MEYTIQIEEKPLRNSKEKWRWEIPQLYNNKTSTTYVGHASSEAVAKRDAEQAIARHVSLISALERPRSTATL